MWTSRRARRAALIIAALALAPLAAPAQPADAPLSAIEWLDRHAPAGAAPGEPPVAESARVPKISTFPLASGPAADAVGLLPPSVTGFPQTLWSESRTDDLLRLVTAQRVTGQPAMQDLLHALLLAEALPPADAGPEARLLLARLDTLARLGAVAPAEALVARAGPGSPALFARWFDLALLLGDPSAPCAALRDDMALSPDLAPRVFCLARGGDWAAAASTLDAARALDAIGEPMGDLLARFLDPAGAETPDLPPSRDPTPLEVRLREAVGVPLPVSALPRRFAVMALGGEAGWRAQIAAAERLARAGAIPENRLLGIYTARAPAASGGLWDRVAAVQDVDAALSDGDAAAAGRALLDAWPLMRDAGLGAPFARLFGADLAALPLTGAVREAAFEVAMQAPDYERHARRVEARTSRARFLVALAAGTPARAPAPDARAAAVAEGFDAVPPARLSRLIEAGRLGEAILEAMALYASGREGDLPDLADALAGFRAVGLEDVARRAAIEVVLAEPAR
ncbi:hypothetical protein [Rhodosalinus sp.]|uniref:hypothetical protein n=1 Tax=Rhodosalinus sp. TaxID=2047741 RepID=UPI003567AD53